MTRDAVRVNRCGAYCDALIAICSLHAITFSQLHHHRHLHHHVVTTVSSSRTLQRQTRRLSQTEASFTDRHKIYISRRVRVFAYW